MNRFGNHNKDSTQRCHSLYESISCTAQARSLAGSRYNFNPKLVRDKTLACLDIKSLQTSLIGSISLAVDAGDCICISGPSGAGKSLFLRAVADLDPHTGEIFLNGKEHKSQTAHIWRKQAALLPAENYWWLPNVADHFCTEPSWLEHLGMDHQTYRKRVTQLSSGEKQRLAILRLLQNNPKVLLLDEPTSSLDPKNVTRVESLIQTYLANNNACAIWVSHDPNQIQRIANRSLYMQNGTLGSVNE